MSKNRLYVYTFIFFFMVCIGLIAGSYTVNMNKKHWLEAQNKMNPHAQINDEAAGLPEQAAQNKDRIILQMLFDVYATVNASADTERACAEAAALLQNSTELSSEKQKQVLEDINASLQAVIQSYSPKLVSVQENVEVTLQAMLQVNLIPDTDKEILVSSLKYLYTHMNTLAEMGHLMVRNENPFSKETTNKIAKKLATMTKERGTIQQKLEQRISIRLENLNKDTIQEIVPKDSSVF